MRSIPMREVRQLAEQEARYSINSPLLFGAHMAIDPESRINILDLSPANPQLIEFFEQYHCKIFLPGCRDELLGLKFIEEDGENNEAELATTISSCLNLPANDGLPLDLVLLWDLPNYLDKRVLSLLIARLAEFCDKDTFLHIYIHTRQTMPELPADYRLMPDNRVMVDMPDAWNKTCPMYYQELLHKIMAPFRVARGMLLSNGLQEYILRPKLPVS